MNRLLSYPIIILCVAVVFAPGMYARARVVPATGKPQVAVQDVPYRVLVVLPYTNNVPRRYNMDYLKRTTAVYLREQLRVVTNVVVTPADIRVPSYLLNNTNIILNYGTNFSRSLRLGRIETAEQIVSGCPACSNNFNVLVSNLAADYIITGSISGSDREHLTYTSYLYFVSRKSNAGPFVFKYSSEIASGAEEMAQPIIHALTAEKGTSLVISSEPPEALVYLNGRYIGRTPARFPYIPAGPLQVDLRMLGRQSFSTNLTVSTNQIYLTNIRLASSYISSAFSVTSRPTNALVYFDSRPYGITPARISNIEAGKYRVRIMHDGYLDYYSYFKVSDTGTPDIQVTLKTQAVIATRAQMYKRSRTLMWAFTYIGLAGVIGGVYCYDRYDKFTYLYENSTTTADANKYYTSANNWLGGVFGCAGFALGSFATAIVFMIRAQRFEEVQLANVPQLYVFYKSQTQSVAVTCSFRF